MVAKGKASTKRKQQKEEEVEAEKQEQSKKRSKKQEEKEQQQAADEAADEAEDSDGSLGEFDEGEDDSSDDGEPANTDIFEAELRAREEELGKHCMVVGTLDEEEEEEKEGDEDKDEDEDGKQPSLEQLRALARVFVPKKVEEYYAELAEALSKIGGPESDEEEDEDEEGMDPAMKAIMAEAGWSFRMLTTRHSYPMHELLKASLAQADKAIKSNKWEDGFCHWAATVQAARRETHWFQDTDVPEVAEGIYEKLRTQWLKLQKHSDEELGGLVVEGAASTKEAFSAFLQALADDIRSMELNVKDVVKS